MIYTLAQGDAEPARGMSLLDYIAAGGPIGLIIILLSFVVLGLIIAGLIQIRLAKMAPPETVERLDAMFKQNDIDGAIALSTGEEADSFLTRTLGTAMVRCQRSPFGFLELKSALEESGQQQVARLYRSTEWIGLIATVAPMLGLLGTVVGILQALDSLRASEGVPRPDELAGGISLALVTTVMGLVVAIPCTFAFAYLRSRIDQLADEVAEIVEGLTSGIEGAGQQQTPSRPAAGARAG